MTLAYDNGINLFDTAEVYAAGKYVSFRLGKVVQAAASLGRARDPATPRLSFTRGFTHCPLFLDTGPLLNSLCVQAAR